uniref:Uncharacterized protein n=1 Tax=Cacopsylla melanoneura TaxID=428564 RepID=A0A8D9A3V0_9HEMI
MYFCSSQSKKSPFLLKDTFFVDFLIVFIFVIILVYFLLIYLFLKTCDQYLFVRQNLEIDLYIFATSQLNTMFCKPHPHSRKLLQQNIVMLSRFFFSSLLLYFFFPIFLFFFFKV